MKGFPPDLLIVVFLLALAIVQILRKSRRPRKQPLPQPARSEIDPEHSQWLRTQAMRNAHPMPDMSASHFGRARAPDVSAPEPGGRFSRNSLMGNRRDLRKAIVIAAILGPCRAIEPHDIR
jgi:hypothetical protein